MANVLIVGAGPAGLTAAHEAQRLGLNVCILEKDETYVGGISRTVVHNGYRFDIGGHRFFSKNSEICRWWKDRLPKDFIEVERLSRIYFNGHFFEYPLRAMDAFKKLGPLQSSLCVISYLYAQCFPRRPEVSFEDWVSNHFGARLFHLFFRSYTEKVWGISCDKISADWASQRIKGLSLWKAVLEAFRHPSHRSSIKTLQTRFSYPRLGPGMMWEKTRDEIQSRSGEVHMGHTLQRLETRGNRIDTAFSIDAAGVEHKWNVEHIISSAPLRDLVRWLKENISERVAAAGESLQYRDFITVALVLRGNNPFPDNWIYIHDPTVRVGRIQNFNNWSAELIGTKGTVCLGFEYFCKVGDPLWNLTDNELVNLATRELATIGIAPRCDLLDSAVVRVPDAYPVYTPEYKDKVRIIREGLKQFINLHTIGRNGMHKYNNQDHSMLTGLLAARNIVGEAFDPWRVNGDAEYLEAGSAGEDSGGRLSPMEKKPTTGS